VELDYKALTFIAYAIEHWMNWHREQLQRVDLTDDDRSDLTNDLYYLRALLADVQETRRRSSALDERDWEALRKRERRNSDLPPPK
jgi:hypothetical protein